MADDQAWAIGAEQGAQAGRDRREHKRSRQEQLQDEQRNQKLGVYTDLFHNDRISPAELAHAVEDVYHDAEPEKKMTILGRIFNHKKAKQQAADAARGSQTRATEEQGIIAGAKSPADVATAQAQGEAQADTAKKRAAIQALPALFPEATPEQLSEMKERILSPGAIHRPTADENKREDYRAAVQGGYKGSFEKWVAEQSAGGRVAGTPTKGRPAWKKNANGSFSSVLLDPQTNQPIPGTENKDVQPPAGMAGRITTGFYHFVDENGQVHQVEETHTSMPAGSGGGKGPAPRAPSGGGDKVLGKKDTATTNAAKKDYVAAVKLSSIADQVAKNPNDAINQKRLAVALERQSAGRFTVQALDYIIKAGWGNTIEQWANNPSTGALPADVMRQLIDGAHQNLKAAKDAVTEAQNMGNSNSPAPKADADVDAIVKALKNKPK